MRTEIEFEIKTQKLGLKKITVYEVSVDAVISELRQKAAEKKDGNIPIGEFMDLIKHCCSMGIDEFKQLYPSEQKVVIEKFKEANQDFFLIYPKIKEVITKLGIIDAIVEWGKQNKIVEILKAYFLTIWQGDLNKESADLSKPDTESRGSMDGDFLNDV